MPDPDHEIRGVGVESRSSRPLDKGGARSAKQIFSTLRATVWSNNKGGVGCVCVGGSPPLDPPLKCYFYGLFRGLKSETPNIQDIFVLFMTSSSQGKGTWEGLLKPTRDLGFENSKNLAQKLSRVLL